MNILENDDLIKIVGGASISGAIINAFISAGNFIYGLGRDLGSSFRRIGTNNLCPLR